MAMSRNLERPLQHKLKINPSNIGSSLQVKKPFLSGTSNTRQGDPFGLYRIGSKPFHDPSHQCCNAIDQALFLSIASIPGLSISKLDTHTVPIFPHTREQRYGGLTLRGVVQKAASDPLFNGHFCLWFMGNDAEFIMMHRHHVELAVERYEEILSTKLFQGIHLERLYLITAPLRKSDFTYDRVFRCKIYPYKMKFNSQLRKVFGDGSRKINGFPVTLVDLNVCIPEMDMENPKFYCGKEKLKVHINEKYYRKFLTLLHNILENHDGLLKHSDQLAATPSISYPQHSELLMTNSSAVSPPVQVSTPLISPTLLQHSEQTMAVPLPALLEAQDGGRTPLSQAYTHGEVATSIPSDTGKPRKTCKRGRNSKTRNLDPFRTMKINCDPID